MIGAIVYGCPSRNEIKACGYSADQIIELKRLWIEDGTVQNTESFFIGRTLRTIRKAGFKAVVSFADSTVDHRGTIYKATNFKLERITAPNYHYADKDGNRFHKRAVWARAKKNGVTESFQAFSEGLVRVKEDLKFKYTLNLTPSAGSSSAFGQT